MRPGEKRPESCAINIDNSPACNVDQPCCVVTTFKNLQKTQSQKTKYLPQLLVPSLFLRQEYPPTLTARGNYLILNMILSRFATVEADAPARRTPAYELGSVPVCGESYVSICNDPLQSRLSGS